MQKATTRTGKDSRGNAHELTLLYTDLLGHQWWAFIKPLQMPAQRTVSAEQAAEWANLNMTKPDLLAYVERMEVDGNAGNIVGMFKVLGYMKERLNWACDSRSLLELAKCYFLIDDEPVDGNTEKHMALKEQVWNEDPACRGFFLNSAFVLTKGYSTFSAIDIQDYSRAQEILMRVVGTSGPQPAAPKSASKASRTSFMKSGRTSTRKPSS